MNLLVSRQARADIRSGARFYDERDPDVCTRFLNDVGGAFDTVTDAPDRWPIVHGLPSNRRMHYYVMPDFPYTVVYQRRGEDTVEIVAVAHHNKRRQHYRAPRAR